MSMRTDYEEWGALMGVDSGENDARNRLLLALGPDVALSHTIDREKGDELRIEFPDGAFVVSADRLRLGWDPAPVVRVDLGRRPRPRWQTWAAIVAFVYVLVVLPPSILTPESTVDHVSGIGASVTALVLAVSLWWGRT